MTKLKDKKMVPELRFGEFYAEWESYKIGRLGSFKGGGTPSTKISEYWEGEIPWISSSDVNEDDVINLNITRYLTNKAITESATKIIPKNSVLFVSRVGVGKLAVSQVDLCTSQDFASLILKKDSSYFVAYYFIAKNKLLHQYSQGTSIKGFTTGDLKSIPINLPSLPEQKKIANFLSSMDKKIQELTRKKELLEAYKKGLMQQLFSGKLRFKPDSRKGSDKDGKEFPAWEEKLYGDVFSFYSTNSFSRDNLNYESGDVKNIHYGDIHTKFATQFKISEELVPFVNDEVDISKIKKESYCMTGDLVIADASEDYEDIGKTIELVELNNELLVAGLHTFLARPNKTKMFIGFSGYLVQAWYIRKQIMTIAQGTKVLGLSMKRMAKLKVNIPCLQEQEKIACLLSEFDQKITAINTQITKTQTFKKGLLQKMFV